MKEQHFTEAAVSVLPSPLAHTPIYWVRATGARPVPARGTTGRSKFYYDRFGFVIGRALVTLSATGDPHPFPPATERDLLSMLEARAKARNL